MLPMFSIPIPARHFTLSPTFRSTNVAKMPHQWTATLLSVVPPRPLTLSQLPGVSRARRLSLLHSGTTRQASVKICRSLSAPRRLPLTRYSGASETVRMWRRASSVT